MRRHAHALRYALGVTAGLVAGFAIWTALIWAQLGVPTPSSQWDALALGLKMRLAERAPGRRLLVLAGSSGNYGIRCAALAARTGLACINLAVHAGFRLRYTVEYAKRVARPGDILLLAFEYQVYGEQGSVDPVLADFVMARDPAYLRTISVPALARFVLSVDGGRLEQGLIARVATPSAEATDVAHEFNANGDDVTNQPSMHTPAMVRAVRSARPIRELISRKIPTRLASETLRDLVRWSEARGITVWATFPATVRFSGYDSSVARGNLERIERLYRELRVPVLEDPRDVMWPVQDFFDSQYHPMAQMADLRSRALAERVCRMIPCPVSASRPAVGQPLALAPPLRQRREVVGGSLQGP